LGNGEGVNFSLLGPIGSEQMLRAVLESASQAILSVDREGKIRSANRRAADVFGYAPEELIGQSIELLIPAPLREQHIRHRSTYFQAPRVRPMGLGMDLMAQRKDGVQFPVEISLSYIESDNGIMAIAFVSDISARKQLEEQLIQSQKMEAVGRLAGGIAHDFNNLLTIISGYNRLLLDRLPPQDANRGYAEEILKAAERAAALTRQLLMFSRREMIHPRVINLNRVISAASQMLRRLIPQSIELVFVPHPNLGNVKADPGQMEQALVNLVINARDAMPKGGRITIETANVELDHEYSRTHLGVAPGRYVMMAVSDSGHGMDPETKRHIFEPFFTTKTAGHGTGLGLSTVYGIVKQNHGDIWVYSELERGTTFKVYLPRVDQPEEQDQRPPEIPTKSRLGSETILVVEDEPGVRNLIRTILTENGYRVLVAADVLEALQISQQHDGPIDLLLTDVVLPHASGVEVAKHLRVSRPGVRVLYMSGYTENAVAHQSVLDADVELLPKPFSFEQLLSRVRQLLDAAGPRG
jgi:two-component system cell cycle sensor histidine kinase/response regulator CckA